MGKLLIFNVAIFLKNVLRMSIQTTPVRILYFIK